MKLQRFVNPPTSQWAEIVARPAIDTTSLFDVVRPIVDDVRQRGDAALRDYEARFDRVQLDSLAVSPSELAAATELVSAELQTAIRQAHDNIARFHSAQRFEPIRLATAPGVVCEQRAVPIERVGLYIPGGSAPLFSTVLMLAVPAQIAGCRDIVLCTPPRPDGSVHPAILFAAQLCGVTRVFKLGGSQAIAAMACGTESVPKVDKIFGPGNAYVMAAKQWVSLSGVAIDMPAGPSEVQVIADETCEPAFVAADLLSQAEHGPDSQVVLVATTASVADAIEAQLSAQLALLPRSEVVQKSLAGSRVVILDDAEARIALTNLYAPEHLILATSDAAAVADRIWAAGSIFIGNYSCESAGDYASGTNHTLPTLGYARAYSGLSLDSFQRKLTLQTLSAEGIRSIGQTVVDMARAEQLDAHALAMQLRIDAVAKEAAAPAPQGIDHLVRPNILSLAPYSCARDEFDGGNASTVFLDANESPFGQEGLNRYPDPLQHAVKERLAELKGVRPTQVFLGNGSDEAIDLIFRVFCRPRIDNVVTLAPTYGMYEVCADINHVECRKVQLNPDFSFSADAVLRACDAQTKAIFLCSPNNPTGNLLDAHEIQRILREFGGIVVVDEAYIDFCPEATWRPRLDEFPRLVVLSTFSKAWASAAIRLGMAFASESIIGLMNKVKYPYNVNELSQRRALELLAAPEVVDAEVQTLLRERQSLSTALQVLPQVVRVHPSDANFLLVEVTDANALYRYLAESNIIVRNRHRVALCADCLRITVGTPDENQRLLAAISQF